MHIELVVALAYTLVLPSGKKKPSHIALHHWAGAAALRHSCTACTAVALGTSSLFPSATLLSVVFFFEHLLKVNEHCDRSWRIQVKFVFSNLPCVCPGTFPPPDLSRQWCDHTTVFGDTKNMMQLAVAGHLPMTSRICKKLATPFTRLAEEIRQHSRVEGICTQACCLLVAPCYLLVTICTFHGP